MMTGTAITPMATAPSGAVALSGVGLSFVSFDSLIAESVSIRTRQHRTSRLTLLGLAMIVIGAMVLSLPVTLTLATLPTLQTHTTYPLSTVDQAMLDKAKAYDQGLLNSGQIAVGDAPDPFTPSTSTPAYEADQQYQAQLDPLDSMARLTIPKVGVDVMVGHGTSTGTLETGAGHVYGTTLPVGDKGNSVIAGHRGLGARLLFYRLGELSSGDLVYTTAAGQTVAWKIDRITRAEPGSDEERQLVALTPNETRLTLYTCDPPGLNTRRLILGAHRIPYVDAVSVPGQSDPWRPWIAGGVTGLSALVLALVLSPRTITAQHKAPSSQPVRRVNTLQRV